MLSDDPDEQHIAGAIITYVVERAKREREEQTKRALQAKLKGHQ